MRFPFNAAHLPLSLYLQPFKGIRVTDLRKLTNMEQIRNLSFSTSSGAPKRAQREGTCTSRLSMLKKR